jgi:predicted transcriptional regulator
MKPAQITPAQCREARALIGISQSNLAQAAVVPATSVADFEAGATVLEPADLDAIQDALSGPASNSPTTTGPA